MAEETPMIVDVALLNIQYELKAPKNQMNKFGGYAFRSCEDILEAVKPLLKKYGCFITLSDKVINVGTRYYIEATAKIRDAGGRTIEASGYAREPEIQKGMAESQITGAASSYARKYALNGLLAIDDAKDVDTTKKEKVELSEVITVTQMKEVAPLLEEILALTKETSPAFAEKMKESKNLTATQMNYLRTAFANKQKDLEKK